MFKYKIKNSKRLPSYTFQGHTITDSEWYRTEEDLPVDRIDFIMKEEYKLMEESLPFEFKAKAEPLKKSNPPVEVDSKSRLKRLKIQKKITPKKKTKVEKINLGE